jgi:cell wall-associated NlpC family hydrolase
MSAQAYYTYGTRVNHTNLNNLNAKKGDIVIFNSRTGAKHIGFFWQYNAATRSITILGGNQNGTVKLSNFPFSLRDGDFYVTHIRRNWEVPLAAESTPQQNFDPRGNQLGPVSTPTVTPQQNFDPRGNQLGPVSTPTVTPPGIYSTNPASSANPVTSTRLETTESTAIVTTRGATSTTTTRVSPFNEPVPLSPHRARRRLQSQSLREGVQYVINGRVYTALRVGPLGQLDPNAQIKLIDEFDRLFG